MFSSRNLLIALAVKYQGDWNNIYLALCNREEISEEEITSALGSLKCKTITIIDKDYPKSLLNIYRPPFVLFYYGDITYLYDKNQNLAVIGSRDHTLYGKEVTENLVKNLCHGYVIVSGLAKGIDAIAHKVAIENRGKTIAVLGSGIDVCYPTRNWDLYQIIKDHHLLISEYPNNVIPDKEHFPARNRIVAGLCKGVLVTEAHTHSGTLITVTHALNSNDEVLCVPCNITRDSLCNKLIQEGATLVTSADDVRYELERYQNK